MLKALAKESGRSFSDVLQEELGKLQEVHSTNHTSAGGQDASFEDSRSAEVVVPGLMCCTPVTLSTNAKTNETRTPELKDPTKRPVAPVISPNSESTIDGVTVTTSPFFPPNIVDPPSVQRMVVEHIAAIAQYSTVRLRAFSGRRPRTLNEPDFDTWRTSVDFLLSDLSISDLRSR